MEESPGASVRPAPPLTFGAILKRLGPVGPMSLAAMVLPGLGGFCLLYYMSDLGPWLRERGLWGGVLYVAVFALGSGLALLPTYAQSLLGGWTFGAFRGGLGAMLGIFGGAVIGYAVARRSAGSRVTEMIAERPKWQAVYDALLKSGAGRRLLIITLIRLPPNSPFALCNVLMAATRVPVGAYLLGTVVGIAPRTLAAVYVGARLENLSSEPPNARWLTIASIVLAIMTIAIIGRIAQNAVSRLTS